MPCFIHRCRMICTMLVLALAGAACTQALPPSTPTAAPRATLAAVSATPLFPEAPASETLSPSPAPNPTETPIPAPTLMAALPPVSLPLPSLTPTSAPPYLTILSDSRCMIGPGEDYLLRYGLFAYNWMRAIGRNPDGTWLNIKAANDPLWNACWIQTEKVRFDSGSIKDVPVVSMVYSYSSLYQPPAVVSASREGNVVTVSWQPVYMTEDDVRGYLVEAWVCRDGRQVFVPVGRTASFAQNNNSDRMSLEISDEPGCDVPSSARLYTVEKHGYTPYSAIPWPGVETTGTAPATPVPAGTPAAASPGLQLVQIPQYTDCLYGPGEFFLYKTSLPAGSWMEVAGRSPDGGWIAVQEPQGWDPCWIPVGRAQFSAGDPAAIPVTYPTLPRSFWYKPPVVLPLRRNGEAVTVAWKAVNMAEYDYRGYLIIARVCQGGRQVYLPVSIAPPYAENSGTLSVTIQDEPGCKEASSATIHTAEKRGYSGTMIFWPGYD